MEPSFLFYVFIGFALLLAFLSIKASVDVPSGTNNRGLLRTLNVLSWLSWLPMLILLLLIGMVWPAPYSEAEPQQADWCYYQTLGHNGKTVYELESYFEKRVDLVLSDLITGKEQKRIPIITGESATLMTANTTWNGTTLAFMMEGSLLAAIKGDSMLFLKDVSNGLLNKSISWNKAKKHWLVASRFKDSSGTYIKADHYDAYFAALLYTDTLQSDDTIKRPNFFFINGNWWGINNLGRGGTSFYSASSTDSTMLHFTQVSTGEAGDTAWWIPGVRWSMRNLQAKYLASAFGIRPFPRPSDFDTVYHPFVYPYAEMRPDTALFRLAWCDDDNYTIHLPATQVSISFDTLRVTMRKQWHRYSPFHSRADREIIWYGKNNSQLQNTFLVDPCNGIFLKGDTLVVKGFGQGRRALFSVATGKRLDHPGMMANYRRYLGDPENNNWPLLLPLIVLLALPLKQLLRRKTEKSAAAGMRPQLYFAFIYLCISVAAWYILIDRAYS